MLPAKRINGQNWLPDFFNDFFEGNALSRLNGSAPAMNVIEDEKGYCLDQSTRHAYIWAIHCFLL